jgi:hypothetical protein
MVAIKLKSIRSMNNNYVQFTEFFDKEKWSYHQHGNKPVIHTHCKGDNGRWVCVAMANEPGEVVIFLSLLPSVVPVEKRATCAELLTRINYDLNLGCFEMDHEDGDLRFRTSLVSEKSGMTQQAVKELILSNVYTVDRFYGAIMKVLHGGASPKAVLKKKEKKAPTVKGRLELN